jgi:hypothetical protein
VERETLVEFSQLHHRKVRIAQLHDLQCTNCHSYHSGDPETPAAQTTSHLKVQTTTCFTCHFNNEGFNTGTNRCLMCHSPPQQEIVVHKELSPELGRRLQAPELSEKSVKMSHTDILAQKVDCIACHADVARDDSTVSRRDCERCHDQPRFFAEWKEPFTLDLVTQYHKVHIYQQRAKCLDCHSEIQHRLVRSSDAVDTGFLSSALSRCTHCHPNHHADQVKLLSGEGGLGVPKSDPNPMFGSRTNCYGCHTELIADSDGATVLKGSQKTCIACHGERYEAMFEQWKAGVQVTLEDAEKTFHDARKTIEQHATASEDARKRAAELLAIAEADLQLVKRANGIHNATYALELLDSVTAHSQRAVEALGAK